MFLEEKKTLSYFPCFSSSAYFTSVDLRLNWHLRKNLPRPEDQTLGHLYHWNSDYGDDENPNAKKNKSKSIQVLGTTSLKICILSGTTRKRGVVPEDANPWWKKRGQHIWAGSSPPDSGDAWQYTFFLEGCLLHLLYYISFKHAD